MSLTSENPIKNGVIVAIDIDNLLISSAQRGQKWKGYDTEVGFHKMFEWIQTFGKILCVHFYLSSRSRHSLSDDMWDGLWEKYKEEFLLEYVYCPKKEGEDEKKIDNVDQHLMYYTEQMAKMFKDHVKYLCLASGDLDYSPLLWRLKREADMQIAFVLGSELAFSRVYSQMGIIAKRPVTGEELIHYFSPHKK